MIDYMKQYSLETKTVNEKYAFEKDELIEHILKRDEKTGKIKDPLNKVLIENTIKLPSKHQHMPHEPWRKNLI